MELPRLHLAAWDGNIQLVRQFYSDGVNNKAGFFGKAPLHLAAENGHAQICSELMRHGADLDIRNIYGNTYIHFHN